MSADGGVTWQDTAASFAGQTLPDGTFIVPAEVWHFKTPELNSIARRPYPRGTLQNRPMRDTSKPANRNRQDRVSYSRLQSAKAREKLEPSAKLNYTVKT